MTRRTVREQLFKLIFRIEFNDLSEMDEQTRLFYEEETEDNRECQEEVESKLASVMELIPDIDNSISLVMTGWTLDRIGKVELAILRLAAYEIKYDEDVPASVAINEAVELSKKYGSDETPAFVNGVLSKLI